MTFTTAVRTFTMPKPLGEKLATSQGKSGEAGDSKRSGGAAKESTDTFSQEAKAPLAAHRNPESKPGITFAAQDRLPKLPIPDLDETCRKYLEALKPLQSPREHQDTIAAVNEFKRRDGPDLQERLKKYATGKSSYIEQFCRQLSYQIVFLLVLTLRRV
jgi:carnitine O-acetyltransferase